MLLGFSLAITQARNAAEVLGPELRGNGTTGATTSSTATAASYNTGTGAGTASRVLATDMSYVTWTALTAGTYKITYQTTSATSSATTQVRSGDHLAAVVGSVSNGASGTFYVTITGTRVTLAASGNGSTVGFTVQSLKRVL